MIAVLAYAADIFATGANCAVRLTNERINRADPVCDGPRDVLHANGAILALGENLFQVPNGRRIGLGITAVDISQRSGVHEAWHVLLRDHDR